jgi:hypothetical protein
MKITAQLDVEPVIIGKKINKHSELVPPDGVLRVIRMGVGGWLKVVVVAVRALRLVV